MNCQQVIQNYKSLSTITAQMLQAAENSEWDHLVELEKSCSQHVATMKPVDASAPLDEETRKLKVQLIKKILADDAAIRNKTEVWMEQLKRIMQTNRQEQKLQQAYGSV